MGSSVQHKRGILGEAWSKSTETIQMLEHLTQRKRFRELGLAAGGSSSQRRGLAHRELVIVDKYMVGRRKLRR